jgi:hypothetical protein
MTEAATSAAFAVELATAAVATIYLPSALKQKWFESSKTIQ